MFRQHYIIQWFLIQLFFSKICNSCLISFSRAYNLDLGQPRAAKIVRCIKHSDKDKVKEEINIMNRLQHKKLLQLESAFEFQKEIILVTEL